jgi:hypothetical protein
MTVTTISEYIELSDASRNPAVLPTTRELLSPAQSPAECFSRIEVWYAKDYLIDTVRLSHDGGTHAMLGVVAGRCDWHQLFGALQGEFWSPNGEARSLIKRSGLHHTSMSVGDVLVYHKPDGSLEVWRCVDFGWRQLADNVYHGTRTQVAND